MGNWLSTKRYYYFLPGYEDLVNKLDASSVKLAESINLMNALTEQLSIQMERDKGVDKSVRMNDVVNLERSEFLISLYLVQTMKDSVVSNGNKTFHSIIELLKYVSDVFNNKMSSLDTLKDEFELEHKIENQFEEVNYGEIRRLETIMNNMDKEIKTLRDERDKYIGKTEHLKEILGTCRKENKQLSHENRKLNEESTKKDKITQSETKAKEALMAKVKGHLDAAKEQIKRLHTDNEKSISEHKAHTEKLKVRMNELKSELMRKKNELDSLMTKGQLKTKQIEQLNLQVQTLTENKEDISQIIEKLKRDKQYLNQQVQTLTKNNGDQSQMIEKLKRDKQDLNKQVQTTSNLNKDQSQMIDDLKRSKRDFDEKMSAQLKDNADIKKESKEKIEMMSIELRRLKQITSKRVISMQVLFCKRAAMTDKIEEELTNRLKLRFDTDQINIRFELRATSSNVEPGAPLIVICMTVSRIGSDVGNAIQGINLTGNTALVVVHHKDSHALPQQTSDGVLTSSAYEHLGGIFDIAYQRDKGIYECGMNSTSLIGLVNFIEKVGVRRPMFDEHY